MNSKNKGEWLETGHENYKAMRKSERERAVGQRNGLYTTRQTALLGREKGKKQAQKQFEIAKTRPESS